MGRTKAKIYAQPNEYTCGPTALKIASEILGKRHSLNSLITICKTTAKNGTSIRHMIAAANKLGLHVLAVEWATLNHLKSAIKYSPSSPRAVIVDYLYDLKEDASPHEDSGHYATVASFSSRDNRIILFDPATGKKKSYEWSDFQNRWYDFDFKKKKLKAGDKQFKLVKNWNNRLMLILASNPKHLPKFKTSYAKLFPASQPLLSPRKA